MQSMTQLLNILLPLLLSSSLSFANELKKVDHCSVYLTSPPRIAEAFKILDSKPRTGWVLRGIPPEEAESILSHTQKLEKAARLYPIFGTRLNRERMVKMAPYHDIGEYKAPDYTPHDKITPEQKHAEERQAIIDLIAGDPTLAFILDLWEEYNAKATPEAKILSQLDKLDAIVQALEYEKQGYAVQDLIDHSIAKITDPILSEILEKLLKRNHPERNYYDQYFEALQSISHEVVFDKNNFYWNYPSDHLPVIGNISLEKSQESFKVITWNIQNKNYFHYMLNQKDPQGLISSGITEDPHRDHTTFKILSEIFSDSSPSIIALQEVDDQILAKLKLWAKMKNLILFYTENPGKNPKNETIDHGVILVDPNLFSVEEEFKALPYKTPAGQETKYIQSLRLKSRRGVEFLLTNTHRFYVDTNIFTEYLNRRSDLPILIVGDLNLNQEQVIELIAKYPHYAKMKKPANAFTHIDTSRNLVDYDHVLFSGAIKAEEDPILTVKAQKAFHIKKRHP